MRTNLTLLLVRVAPATVFVAYGYPKRAGRTDRFVGLLTATGFPTPDGLVRAVAAPELGGGVLLLLALGTRPVAALLAAEMGAAVVRLLWPRGYLRGGRRPLAPVHRPAVALQGDPHTPRATSATFPIARRRRGY